MYTAVVTAIAVVMMAVVVMTGGAGMVISARTGVVMTAVAGMQQM